MGGFYLTGANNVPFVGATLTAGAEFEYCARDARGALRKSPTFTPEQVFNATYMVNTARTEQLSYLGYNGVTGSMDTANSTYYGLRLILNHTFGMLNNSPMIKTIPYKSNAANTQYDMALDIAEVCNKQFDRESLRAVTAEAVCNEGVTAANCLDNNLTVVYGSKVITGTATFPYNTAAGNMAVGDFIRLGATAGAPAATALDDAVYRVISIDAATTGATLDRAVTVPSGTYTAAGDMAEVITSAEGVAANWGIRFDGHSVADADFNPVTDKPFVVSFELEAGDFTTATVTYTTAPFIGRGTYQLISSLEAYTQFQDKTREITAYPPTVRNLEAVAGAAYCVFTFDVLKATHVDPTTGQRPVSKHRIMIAMLNSLAAELAEYIVDLGASLGCGAILTGNQAI
jgi:hypothetical protein